MIFDFVCPGCGYTARVSGGLDCGMLAVVRTMTCEDCKKLVDVLIGRYGQDGPTGDSDYDKDLDICPKCRGYNIRAWSSLQPCPRCDCKMIKGDDAVVMWD